MEAGMVVSVSATGKFPYERARSFRVALSKRVREGFIAAFSLLICSQAAWALSVSPSPNSTGNYTVSWSYPLGCSTTYVQGFPIQLCTRLEEIANGQFTIAATSGTSKIYSGKAAGTYTYRIWGSYSGYPGSGEVIWEGPVSVVVSTPTLPKPDIIPNVTPYGPWGNPYYYSLGWMATNTNEGGCAVQAISTINGVAVYFQTWSGRSAVDSVTVDDIVPGTEIIYYEVQCTGPGGTTSANGALLF